MRVRRQARITALQALYEIDSVQHAPGPVLQRYIHKAHLPAEGEAFLLKLVHGVLKHKEQLDELRAFIRHPKFQKPVVPGKSEKETGELDKMMIDLNEDLENLGAKVQGEKDPL